MADVTTTQIKDTTANPAPLGLLGFGMTTVLLNIHNAGFFELNSMILAMGLCYGGIAQVIAGIMEWKKNNTFATTAFTSYGLFWISLVVLILLPKCGLPAMATSSSAMGAYLAVWGVMSVFMFIGTFKLSRALQIVFGLVTILFFALAIADFTHNESLKVFAGWEGILCGAGAMYTGLAQVLNELYGRTVLPIGAPQKH